MADTSTNMSIDAKESVREGTDESLDVSTPEAETEIPPENIGQQKRKGGRKPIYATSEERKQRNRQAQAAFRERRTEYIKQLEETIRVHETNLHSLQNAHRSAADECLMLRYKNSLLERILLEKGIDVQAELRAKTGSPHLGPTHMHQNMAQPPTVQRAIMNRHHQARRSNSSIAPKLEPGVSFHNNQSPQSRPTPSSHASSPTTSSSGFNHQGVLTPPSSDSQMQHQQQQQQRLHAAKTQAQHALSGTTGLLVNTSVASPLGAKGQGNGNGAGNAGGATGAPTYYPSFQTHIEQLEQEYDAQADMVDDQPEIAGPGPYPEPVPAGQLNQLQGNQPQQLGHPPHSQGMHGENATQAYNPMTQLLDPYDPMLDMDPFGLSASMQFPTQFSFDTSSMR
ncbi:cc3c6c69-0743-4d6a-91dc-2d46e560208f [Sclerotinia trifoliorum]|uniref:Cc3c6c69-0743-4d6a-91dc-2d46e560208f n=1 Tax=Sclerotinia trifoliorum TaxID=28548 RepID=A0A8H2VQ04_9HELO|nr:cc3c6c69-0743-4d6a-91dc-2d46e560208f [Sclerotinia trifoliorum]